MEWLERLDIGACARKRPHALLQAQRQRVAMARALAATPSVLFADEPTATLHRADRAHVLRIVTTAARSHGITVVLATHDAEVAALADRSIAARRRPPRQLACATARRGRPGRVLALRLARGAHPLVLLRRLLVAAASAGVGFLLLCTLTYALSHPTDSGASAVRLLWCLVPLAATVHFAVAVARTDPSTRPRSGLSAVGLGPARLSALAAVSTAVSGTLGSMVALLFFLHLRGDLTGLPFDGAAAGLLGGGPAAAAAARR